VTCRPGLVENGPVCTQSRSGAGCRGGNAKQCILHWLGGFKPQSLYRFTCLRHATGKSFRVSGPAIEFILHTVRIRPYGRRKQNIFANIAVAI